MRKSKLKPWEPISNLLTSRDAKSHGGKSFFAFHVSCEVEMDGDFLKRFRKYEC